MLEKSRWQSVMVILGVLGGACSGGFCFGVLAGASPPRKAAWERLKEFRGGRCFCLHCFNSFVFKKPFFIPALSLSFCSSLLPPSTSKNQKRQNF
jgi:hypothetical protein